MATYEADKAKMEAKIKDLTQKVNFEKKNLIEEVKEQIKHKNPPQNMQKEEIKQDQLIKPQ